MHTVDGVLWTIDQLGAQVALALSVDYAGVPNGRVRDVPDCRTIRYYTTLGLLDRPAEMRGRLALYGPKHLLQLVAIKRLQARALSLAEIQQQLLALTETALGQIARLPDNVAPVTTESPAADLPTRSAPDGRAAAFWSTSPAPVPEGQADNDDSTRTADSAGEQQFSTPGADQPATLQGIRLGEEATLLIEGIRPVYEDDFSTIRTAAAPLIKLLEMRRLIRPREERGTP